MAKQQRRNKGSGTIFRRKSDKLWVAGVELPKNKKTGKRHQRRVYSTTRSGVQAKLSNLARRRSQ